jgi:hypothetical protein
VANSAGHAALPYPIKGARFTLAVPYLDADGDPTDPTTPDTEFSQDGGAFADCAEEVTTISGSNGSGYISLTGAETNCSLLVVAAKVASGPKNTLAVLYPRVLPIAFSGTASAGASGTITLAGCPAITDLLIGCIVRTTGGTGGGGTGGANNQARVITAYTSGRVATVVPNWETTPDATTTFEVLLTDSSILRYADVKEFGGTAVTGRDIGTSVLLSTGTGTGQLDFTSGVVKANATQWLGGTIPAVNVTGVPLVDAKYLLGTIFSTPTVAGIPNVNAKTWNDLATVALPLVPTTAGRTLDVSTGGEAGLDWANVGSPTTALALTGTTIATTQKVDIETIKTNPVVNAGTVTFPTTATLASTTNITAGTITTATTATNLTNAPTAGDFTATMKTSIGTAVAASAVASVTGNVGGNVTGSVGSIAGITFPTNFASLVIDSTGRVNAFLIGILTSVFTEGATGRIAAAFKQFFNIASPAATMDHLVLVDTATTATTATNLTNLPTIPSNWLTAAGLATDAGTEIAAAVWDLATSGHTTSGTFGAAMNAAGSAGDPLSTAVPGAYGAGTAGFLLGTYLDAAISSRSTLTQTQVTGGAYNVQNALCVLGDARIAHLDADVSSRSTYAGADTSGTTTLLSRISGTITISGGKVSATMGSTDYTGNTVQTGDSYARIGAAGAGLTAIGDSRMANLDRAISAVLTTAMTEAYNADGAAPTPAQALFLIMQRLTEFSISGTTITIKKLDGSTTAATLTMDSSTTPTSSTRAT